MGRPANRSRARKQAVASYRLIRSHQTSGPPKKMKTRGFSAERPWACGTPQGMKTFGFFDGAAPLPADGSKTPAARGFPGVTTVLIDIFILGIVLVPRASQSRDLQD